MKVNLLTSVKVAQGKTLSPGVQDVEAAHLKGLPEGSFEVVEVAVEEKKQAPKK